MGKHKIIKRIHVALAIHCVPYLFPNHPVALNTTRSRCYTENARCKVHRYIKNYTDNWKKKSNHFLYCWRRPRPWFRRHQERR